MLNDNLASSIMSYFDDFYSKHCSTEISLSDICNLSSSKRVFADDYVDNGVPFYRGGEITLKQAGEPIGNPLYISQEHYSLLKEKYGAPSCGDILITAVGTIGNSYLVEDEEFYFKDGNIIWLNRFQHPEYSIFIYDFMQSSTFRKILEGICIGSTQTALTIVALSRLKINLPELDTLKRYAQISRFLRGQIQHNQHELLILHEVSKSLLSGLSR